MENTVRTNSNQTRRQKTENENQESSISLSQYSRYLLIIVLGYALATCADEKVKSGVQPAYSDSVANVTTGNFKNFNEIRESDVTPGDQI